MTHAGISRSALPCSIPRSGYTKKHSSISWSVSGDTRGISRGLKNSPLDCFCALRRTALFDSSLGIHEKTLQHKLECFW